MTLKTWLTARATMGTISFYFLVKLVLLTAYRTKEVVHVRFFRLMAPEALTHITRHFSSVLLLKLRDEVLNL